MDNPAANDYTNFTPHPFGELHTSISPSTSNVHRPLIPQTSLSNFGQNKDLRQDIRKSSFNPQGDVIPMLGRSYSTLSRNRNKLKPVIAESQEMEGIYDSVYDSTVTKTTNVADVGPEVEELYDTTIGIEAEQIYDAVAEDVPEDTFNDSFESSGDESIYDKAGIGLDINF